MAKGFVNRPPLKLPQGAPRDRIKVDFANRLQQAIAVKGWNYAETARYASKHLPKGKSIGRDQMSHYIRAAQLPRAPQLRAIAKALGVEPQDLLPQAPTAETRAPAEEVKKLPDGNSWMRINQSVPPPVDLIILALLHGQYGAAAGMLKGLVSEKE